jgi:hypothetical protein
MQDKTEERIQDLEVLVRHLIKPQDGPYFQPTTEEEERRALARKRLNTRCSRNNATSERNRSGVMVGCQSIEKTMLVLHMTLDGRASVTVEPERPEVTAVEIGEIVCRIGPRGLLTRENLNQLAEDLREAAGKL